MKGTAIRVGPAFFAAAAALTLSVDTLAAGLEVAPRGVRPIGRGGAFVAGADDLGAIYYNPAGLVDAGSSILFDASWVNFSSEYTRQALVRQVDPNTGRTVGRYRQTFPTVDGTTPFLPIPTLAGSFAIHRDVVLALGVYAPYAAMASYPESVDGGPSPQRYSLYTLDGSALAVIGLWGAWAPIDELRVGAGFNLMTGSFRSTLDFSGCLPDRFFCSNENPGWDVGGEVAVGPIFAPSANAGVIWEAIPGWRVGASFQGPFLIDAPATLRTRLPQAPPFDDAEVVGDQARVSFDLPWNVRFGIETRTLAPDLRVELAFNYARWSMHDRIAVQPDGIYLSNVATLPSEYYIPNVDFVRNFQDSVGIGLGGEYTLRANEDIAVDLRAGFAFETSGITPEYMTVLTIDSNKVIPSVGAGLHLGESWRLDVAFAYVANFTVEVDPSEAQVKQVVPVVANPAEVQDSVNGGTYASRATVLGVGVVYTFDRPRGAQKVTDDVDDGPAEPLAAPGEPPAGDPTDDEEDDEGEDEDAEE